MQQELKVFTILYEVNKQTYLIGVTNEIIPKIAAMGVNTSRPLPMNIRISLAKAVKELRNLTEEPQLIDYNAPSKQVSKSLLGNFSMMSAQELGRPAKEVGELITELEAKMLAKQNKE